MGISMSDYDVSVLPLIPSDGDISNLHDYLRGSSGFSPGRKSSQGNLNSNLDGKISGSRSREAFYALRNPKKPGNRMMFNPSPRSAPSSLYHFGMHRNFSTPSLRGVKSVSPVPMSDPRPHTVTSHHTTPSLRGAQDDSQSTPTLLPRKIRKSRSASLLSFRKLGGKKGTPVAGSVPLPDAARASPSPVSALGLYRGESSRADNSFSSLDLQESAGNDSSIMMSFQDDLSGENIGAPQSIAPLSNPPPSTTSGSSNEFLTKSPAPTPDVQESLKILAEIDQPWFQPAAPPLPSTFASLAPPVSEWHPEPKHTPSVRFSTSATPEPERINESLSQDAPTTPDGDNSSNILFQPADQTGDNPERASGTTAPLPSRPSMAPTEYSFGSRYSGISSRSPRITRVPSLPPAIPHVTSPIMQTGALPSDSALVLPHTESMKANDSSPLNAWLDNRPLPPSSASQDSQGPGSLSQPASYPHILSPSTTEPKFTYSIVNGIQPKAQQRQGSNNPFKIPPSTKPLPPIELSKTDGSSSHGNHTSEETVHSDQSSSALPPVLPNRVSPNSPPIPLSVPERSAGTLRDTTDFRLSNTSAYDFQDFSKGVEENPAASPNLKDQLNDRSKVYGSVDCVDTVNLVPSPAIPRTVEAPTSEKEPQGFKNDVEDSICQRLKEFQSQQQALRGTIETSRAEILQLREKIRAFRAELDEEVLVYPPTEPLNLSIYEPTDREPSRDDRLRDSLLSMDDLDRRLTFMLESHGLRDTYPYT